MDLLETHADLFRIHRFAGHGLPHVPVVGHHQVEDFAALQRIMHDVAPGAGPECGGIPFQVIGHPVRRNHGAVGRMARDTGRPIAHQLRPDRRMQPVRTNQRHARHGTAVLKPRMDQATILFIARHPAAGPEGYPIVGAAGLQQHPVEVGAVNHRIGVPEPVPELVVKGDMADLVAVRRIHEPQLVDVDRHPPRLVADTQIVEAVERVRADLDSGADLAQLRRLLEHGGGNPVSCQGECRRQSADAPARDDYTCVFHIRATSTVDGARHYQFSPRA